MPQITINYSANLDAQTDMTALCRSLADVLIAQRDDGGKPVFPVGGTRVFAYPAAHCAIADGGAAGRAAGGSGEYAFAFINLRMKRGRSDAVQQRIGQALLAAVTTHFEPLMARQHVGVTLMVDAGTEVFDGKANNLHPLFAASTAA